jgi:hypothetical protein
VRDGGKPGPTARTAGGRSCRPGRCLRAMERGRPR